MQTRISEQYSLEFPFIAAPLGPVTTPELVAAVSRAGGMGMLDAAISPAPGPADLRARVAAVRRLTDRPFGVGFLTPLATPAHLEVCIELRIPVVGFQRSIPPPASIERLHAGGVHVWMQVGSVLEAETAAAAGVDAVIARSPDADGSERGTAGTFRLVPDVVSAIAPVSVLAGGEIRDGRGVVAALALGAEAVQVSARLATSREAGVRPDHLHLPPGDEATPVVEILPAGEIVRRMMAEAEQIITQRLGTMASPPTALWSGAF